MTSVMPRILPLTGFLFACLSLAGLTLPSGIQVGDSKKDPDCMTRAICDVSMIRLLARPEAYEGKRIRVVGELSNAFESTSLSLPGGLGAYDGKNAVWLAAKDITAADGAIVVVEGVYDPMQRGHHGAYSGTIREMGRLDVLRPPQPR